MVRLIVTALSLLLFANFAFGHGDAAFPEDEYKKLMEGLYDHMSRVKVSEVGDISKVGTTSTDIGYFIHRGTTFQFHKSSLLAMFSHVLSSFKQMGGGEIELIEEAVKRSWAKFFIDVGKKVVLLPYHFGQFLVGVIRNLPKNIVRFLGWGTKLAFSYNKLTALLLGASQVLWETIESMLMGPLHAFCHVVNGALIGVAVFCEKLGRYLKANRTNVTLAARIKAISKATWISIGGHKRVTRRFRMKIDGVGYDIPIDRNEVRMDLKKKGYFLDPTTGKMEKVLYEKGFFASILGASDKHAAKIGDMIQSGGISKDFYYMFQTKDPVARTLAFSFHAQAFSMMDTFYSLMIEDIRSHSPWKLKALGRYFALQWRHGHFRKQMYRYLTVFSLMAQSGKEFDQATVRKLGEITKEMSDLGRYFYKGLLAADEGNWKKYKKSMLKYKHTKIQAKSRIDDFLKFDFKKFGRDMMDKGRAYCLKVFTRLI